MDAVTEENRDSKEGNHYVDVNSTFSSQGDIPLQDSVQPNEQNMKPEEMKETVPMMNFFQVMDNLGTSDSTDIVYALDGNGNQVAMGLLVPGQFQEVVQQATTQWIAAEEECTSSQHSESVSTRRIKEEKIEVIGEEDRSSESPEIGKESRSTVIKTYKRRKDSKNTLKEMKLQIKNQVKQRMMRSMPSTSKKLKDKKVNKAHSAVKKKQMNRRRNYDKMYKAPYSIRRQYFERKPKNVRKSREPKKNAIYWDMNIPTQFYEEEYLEFERYLEFTQVRRISSAENPHANSEYFLQQFQMYEKFRKAEDKKTRKKVKSVGKPVTLKKKDDEKEKGMAVPLTNKCDQQQVSGNCAQDSKSLMAKPKDTLSSHSNKINAIKMAILKSLFATSYSKLGKYTSIKTIGVDLPLSQNVFTANFPVEYNGEESVKAVLSLSDLNPVFGPHWHIVNFRHSSTRRKVIGVVKIHYRRKKVPLNLMESNSRDQALDVKALSGDGCSEHFITSFWLRLNFQAVKENIDIQNRLQD